MRIVVDVKLKARKERVQEVQSLFGNERRFSVWVTEPPIEGQANKAVLKALAEYFQVTPSRLRIISGHTSRHKIIEVL